MEWKLLQVWHYISRLWKPLCDDAQQLRPAWIIRALRESGWAPTLRIGRQVR